MLQNIHEAYREAEEWKEKMELARQSMDDFENGRYIKMDELCTEFDEEGWEEKQRLIELGFKEYDNGNFISLEDLRKELLGK